MAACAEKNALWGKFLQASGRKLSDAPPARDLAVESEGCGYETAMGRACWPSRDPIEERGGMNLYGMCYNNSINAIDLLGMKIECCGIESYLKEQGISTSLFTFDASTSIYSAVTGAGPTSGEGLILWRMLKAQTNFKIKDLSIKNLKKHVEARQTIVRNALKADFIFSTQPKPPGNIQLFFKDPQGYFDSINNGTSAIACERLSRIIFETGNKFEGDEYREYDGVWIPGDWGYIKNLAWEKDPNRWGNESISSPAFSGENVFHTGVSGSDDMFWGHFDNHKHPPMSESDWWIHIKDWKDKFGVSSGEPKWRNRIIYPRVGLSK